MAKAITICKGGLNGKPDKVAVSICPIKPIIAPYIGPSSNAAKKAGIESKAIEPNTLMFAPINDKAISKAQITRCFVLVIIISPLLIPTL